MIRPPQRHRLLDVSARSKVVFRHVAQTATSPIFMLPPYRPDAAGATTRRHGLWSATGALVVSRVRPWTRGRMMGVAPKQPKKPEVSPVDKKAKQPKKPKTATSKAKGTSKTT